LATTTAASSVRAEGVLNISNWGDDTNPDLIAKFEETCDVKVTITDYDSNETALAKARLGNAGFDIAVPSHSNLPIWIAEGLLLETNPGQMGTARTSPRNGLTPILTRVASILHSGSTARSASRSTPMSTRDRSTAGPSPSIRPMS
jgi:hypothetical protein